MKTIIALGLAAALATGATIALAPTAAGAATVILSDSHTAWCAQNYRSYNAASDTYIGFDGFMHRCISPAFGGLQTFATISPFVLEPTDNTGVSNPNNPNGQGSGTAFRLYPNDDENSNNGTSNPNLF